jgi:lysyl-tRNA synthetase class 2
MTKIPDLTPIESSMFTGHHYDPNTRQMTVQFKNGSVHQYDDVPMEKHEAFSGSASKGRYFNDHIKSNFASRKIVE